MPPRQAGVSVKGSITTAERIKKCYDVECDMEAAYPYSERARQTFADYSNMGEYHPALLCFPFQGVYAATQNGATIQMSHPRDSFIQPACNNIVAVGGSGTGKSQMFSDLAAACSNVQRFWGEKFCVQDSTSPAMLQIMQQNATRSLTIQDYINAAANTQADHKDDDQQHSAPHTEELETPLARIRRVTQRQVHAGDCLFLKDEIGGLLGGLQDKAEEKDRERMLSL
jgi:hypothetical protein